MFLGHTEVYILQKKDFLTVSMKWHPMAEGSSSGMPCHYTHDFQETYTDKKYVQRSISRQI